MRRLPAPLSVTLPPPSSTTRDTALRTFAVAAIVITTGRGPQENVMTPPAATAATTAADVQLAGVPLPTVRAGCEVSTARAAAGTGAWPPGFPAWNATPGEPDRGAVERGVALGRETALGVAVVLVAGSDGEAVPLLAGAETGAVRPEASSAPLDPDPPQPARTAPAVRALTTDSTARVENIARC